MSDNIIEFKAKEVIDETLKQIEETWKIMFCPTTPFVRTELLSHQTFTNPEEAIKEIRKLVKSKGWKEIELDGLGSVAINIDTLQAMSPVRVTFVDPPAENAENRLL